MTPAEMRDAVIQRKEQVYRYVPAFIYPTMRRKIVESMCTPGTICHWLLTCICVVLWDELRYREQLERQRVESARADLPAVPYILTGATGEVGSVAVQPIKVNGGVHS